MSAALSAAPATPQVVVAVHDLVRERVVLRARRRLAWLRHIEAQTGDDPLARVCLDVPDDEARFYATQSDLQPLQKRLAEVEILLDDPRTPNPLRFLASLFELEVPELDLLHVGIALELTPALAPAFARLTGVAGITEELVRRLFNHPVGSLLDPDGGLVRWRLATIHDAGSGVPRLVVTDPQISVWLSGRAPLDPAIRRYVRTPIAHQPLQCWPVRRTADLLIDPLQAGIPVRLVVAAAPGSGRRTFGATVLRALDLEGLILDSPTIAEDDWSEVHRLVVRHARMTGIVAIAEFTPGRPDPALASELPLSLLVCAPHERPAAVPGVVDVRVDLPPPGGDERAALWHRVVPTSRTWPEEHVQKVARRYTLPLADLAAVGLRRPATADDAAELCRERTRHRLGELGHVLRCPFTMDDLVVPPKVRDHLGEFIFEARDRVEFWERPEARRLYPRGAGLVALFTGSAGTGKTMAAQVLAAELGLDLVRIDLASVVSKYIGETAKSMRRIFGAAAGMSAVLLFDEADALFARRTDVRDAHDRHANADTNYLLQLLEDFAGIAVLASNKRANIDPAFIRRIRHVLDFPRPDSPARRQIWGQVLHELGAGIAPAALDALATLDLSGAQIKNTVLAATFVARSERRPLAIAHLVRGLERELDKDGRAVDRRERERLLAHA